MKKKNIERRLWKIVWKNQFSKLRNSLLVLEKDFAELKYIEMKGTELKIKR